MLAASRERLGKELRADAVVLDIGAWADPFPRADWVMDLMPYGSRGLYAHAPAADEPERFTADRWIVRDVCDREPYPFDDDSIDFVICSHTLEDVRDPVWVCSEMNRIAKAGYIEVPAREEEQCPGVNGPWVGWSHHRWLIDIEGDSISFVHKPALLHGKPELQFPPDAYRQLGPEERVGTMFWEGSFRFGERVFYEPDELDAYLAAIVPVSPSPPAPRGHRLLRRRG